MTLPVFFLTAVRRPDDCAVIVMTNLYLVARLLGIKLFRFHSRTIGSWYEELTHVANLSALSCST